MPRNVIIEMRQSPALARAAAGFADGGTFAATDSELVPPLPGLAIDPTFPPVAVPAPGTTGPTAAAMDVAEAYEAEELPEFTSYIVRGQVDEGDEDRLMREAEQNDAVVGVFADAFIDVCPICPGSPPLGTDQDVARLLCVERLREAGMDGRGVLVAIVDTGINQAHLVARGKSPRLDTTRSWSPPSAPGTGGSWPVGHGTMCAYDALIAAPQCTLLDIALLRSTRRGGSVMEGLLSDAVLAYRHLLDIMLPPARPGEARSLVVNNSWGMFHPEWDFPVGHPGNYSDNPNHPFNRIVATLERAGADILFAAGNCGRDCPDGRCRGVTANAIYGANSHPSVLCVAGVDTTGTRVGYSSIGPGRLTRRKPDISGFTHFRGSGVYAADGGTSAATPVVAGVVAAVRSRRPYSPTDPSSRPARIRHLVRSTALDRGATGYDFEYGHGIINGCRLSRAVRLTAEPTFEGLLRELAASGAAGAGSRATEPEEAAAVEGWRGDGRAVEPVEPVEAEVAEVRA